MTSFSSAAVAKPLTYAARQSQSRPARSLSLTDAIKLVSGQTAPDVS